MDIIQSDELNTVKSLRDKLQEVLRIGFGEGFPVTNSERKLIGYIGTNELEHALGTSLTLT